MSLSPDSEAWTDPPWVLLMPGLSKQAAEHLLELARREGYSYGAAALDPRLSMTFFLDRATAWALLEALSEDPDRTYPVPVDQDGEPNRSEISLRGVVDDLREFLAGWQPGVN